MKPTFVRAFSLAVLSVAMGVRTAQANVVRLEIGRNLFGQGWMFLDYDGHCKVVTAAHVVRGPDGALRLSLVLDGHGREWPARAALVLSADPDIAVLTIPSADTPSACGDGRLSAIGAERRATDLTHAVIATTGQSEVVEVPVIRRASEMDAGGGEIFAVRPTIELDRVMEGWSGSVVRDAYGPIGIVFEVNPKTNEAFAVRVDVIRRLMASGAPQTAAAIRNAGSTPPAIGVLAGVTDDPARGPDLVLGAGWRVTPVKRTVVFLAAFQRPTSVSGVALAAADGGSNGIVGLGIAAQPEGSDDWVETGFCRAPEVHAGAVFCPMLRHTVSRLRILVKSLNDAPIVLNNFALE